jgi:hypothetical protein
MNKVSKHSPKFQIALDFDPKTCLRKNSGGDFSAIVANIVR